MPASKIIYSLTGGTNIMDVPNIEGSAISRNMFTERNTDGDENKDVRTFMQSAPGIKYIMTLGKYGQCDGMYVPSIGLERDNFAVSCFMAYNGNIYRIDRNFNTEVIGTYTIGNQVVFAESGGEKAVLLWVDGYNIYGYDLKTGDTVPVTLPKRITENAYIQPTHIAVVSGSIVLNDKGSGFVYYSEPYALSYNRLEGDPVIITDENMDEYKGYRQVFSIIDGQVQYEADGITVQKMAVDAGTWCFLDDYGTQKYFNGESSSDKCNAIYSVGSLLTLYGPSSIEFWQKGDAESFNTWQRTSYTINKEQGLEAVYSLASVNQMQFCIGTGKANAKCVLKIEGTNVSKISPLWLDRILNDNDIVNTRSWTYSKNNHSFYIFTIGNETYCYDITTGEWAIRSSRNFYNGQNKKYLPLYAVWFNNKIITGCGENGNVYELDENYHREDFDDTHSLPLLRVRQTPVITSNYKPFVIYELALECNTGFVEKYGKMGQAILQVSNDGGYTYGNAVISYAGMRGQYSTRLKWLNLGMVRQCVLKVSYSEDSEFVISDASIRFNELNTGV